ncbi:MAG: ABC transporter permease [Tannerellaceae bacterium]|jgi:D-methionine transport system permease protein|nr:ABC transporter permease [Tannerellaceae bacterium]
MNTDNFLEWGAQLGTAFLETAIMCGIAIVLSVAVGTALGLFIFVTRDGLFLQNRTLNTVTGVLVNVLRSIPFVILLVLLIPLTKAIIGTAIGPYAAAVSLTVASTPFYARLVESALCEVDRGVIEASRAMGISAQTIILRVLLPEALPGILRGITITLIGLVSNSANAGMVGGGGVGDLAIRFGYYRYQTDVMITTVVLLIVLVQIIQIFGDYIARRAAK